MTTKTHYRTCNLCEAMCGLEIKLENEQIVSIQGDKKDPLSRGHICPKAIALQDLYRDPDRLKRPLKRVGEQWEEISWNEAFQLFGERIKAIQTAHGPNSVAVYQGNPSVHNLGTMLYSRDMVRALKTKNRFSATSVDQLPHHLAALEMYGHMNLLPVPDLDRTNYLLVLGGNPLVSNGSMMTAPDVAKRLQAIQDRGGKVVIIDPIKTRTAKKASEHHFIRPGTDVALLLAIANTLYASKQLKLGCLAEFTEGLDALGERLTPYTPAWAEKICGMSAESIRQIASDLAEADKSAVYGRMGISVVKYGSLSLWLVNVINILTGQLDSEGGMMFTSPAADLVANSPGERKIGRWKSRVRGLPEIGGELPVATLAEEILTPGEGQIKALVTSCGNPVLSTPNGAQLSKALEGLDFMVSVDIYLNETTRHADLILPPATGLENSHYDLIFHALAIHNTARYSEPLFPISAEQRYDWQVYQGMIKALIGKVHSPFPAWMRPFKSDTPESRLDGLLRMGPYKLSLNKLRKNPHGMDLGPLKSVLPERLKRKDQRIQLFPDIYHKDLARLDQEYLSPEAQMPTFHLIGRRHLRSNNSWMHNSQRLVKGKERCTVLLHPDDARKLHIQKDSKLTIRSRVGEIKLPVEITEDIMAGVVSVPHGWGHHQKGTRLQVASAHAGASVNDLTDEMGIDELSGNAILNGVPVEIVPVNESAPASTL
ncbi:MAG: molybdopterin oxidoreductase family protein [Bacteroidota bacterium]